MDDTLPSRCYGITMILRVRRKFFQITTFPNKQQLPTQVHSEHWTMFFDGSKMLNGSGAGVVLVSPQRR